MERVKEHLRGQGFVEPPRPDGEPPQMIPKNLASLSGDAVIDFYREVEGWYTRVVYLHAIASCTADEWKNDLNLLLKSLKKDCLTTEEIETDERVIAVRKAVQVAEQETSLYQAQKSSLDRKMKVASRAIEALKIDHDAVRRGGNAGYGSWGE